MKKLAIILPILVVFAIGVPFAYAQEVDESLISEIISLVPANTGAGAFAGFIMSIVAVTGKRLKGNSTEPIKLRLMLITIAITGAVGYFGGLLGLSTAVTVPSAIGITYIVNQTLRPIFAKWDLS